MKLSHRAALMTVATVAAGIAAVAVLILDQLPLAEDRQAEISFRGSIIETGSLPRGSVFPDMPAEPKTRSAPEGPDRMIEDEQEQENGRLAFVPPSSQHFLLGPMTAEQWAAAVIQQGDVVQHNDEEEAEAVRSWSTVTSAAKAAGVEAKKRGGLGAPHRDAAITGRPGPGPRNGSLQARLIEIAPAASERIAARFKAASAPWPPAEIALVAIKDEKALEMHARAQGGSWTFVHRYKVMAASGGAGPKLMRGDKQVPEGIYNISFLNPNSRYHVSMRVNYPNAFDRRMAKKDGRRDLGSDIMIHGKKSSAGCLAMGDEAAEELFVLSASIGLPNVKLVIAPTDLRRKPIPAGKPGQPAWVPKLYTEVASAMAAYKAPPVSTGGSLLSLLGL